MAKLQLDWPKDRDGYQIELAEPMKPVPQVIDTKIGFSTREYWQVPSALSALMADVDGTQIVRKGGRLLYDDRFLIDGLWKRLAKTEPTEEGALEFVERYGFLQSTGDREYVHVICHHIEVMGWLREAIDNKAWKALKPWLEKHCGAIRLHPEFRQEDGWPRPDLFFVPETLLDAIYLQALQDATSGTDLRKCDRPGCPEYRAVGPGTGKWKTNRPVFYCTPKCQKAHAYMKSKGASK